MAFTLPSKGDYISFQFVHAGILGDERRQVPVDAVGVGYLTALKIDQELNVKHKNMFPYFASKVNGIDDPSAYNYIVYRNLNGQMEVVGIPWILDSSFLIIAGLRCAMVCDTWREIWDAPTKSFFASLGAAVTYNVTNK